MSKASELIKNTGVLAIGNFSSKILIFFLVPLYTSVLTTQEYGTYDVIFSSCSLLIPVLTLNIGDAMLRFPLEEKADIPQIARIGLSFTLISGGVVLCLQLIPSMPWRELSGCDYIAPLYLANAMYQLLILLARGTERFSSIAIAGVMSALVMVLLNVLFLLVLKWGLGGFFLANIIGVALPALYLIWCLRGVIFGAYPDRSRSLELIAKMVRYTIPLGFTVVGWWFMTTSGRYIVLAFCGLDANGLYSVANKIPAILNTVAGIFIQAWQVSAIKGFNREDADGFLLGAFGAAEMCIILACAFLIPLSPLLAMLLFQGEFYNAWVYIPFLLIYVVLNTMSGLLSPFFLACYKTKHIAVSTFLGAVVNLALGIPLVMMIGAQGAAIACLCAGLVNWLWRGAKARECIDFDLHMRRSCAVCGLLVLQGFVMISGLDMWLCMAIQVALLLCLLFGYRKRIGRGVALVKDMVLSARG